MKKYILGIFICLLSIILMSHNTYSATLNFPVKLYAVYDVTFDYTGTGGNGVAKKNVYGDTEITTLIMHFNNFSCDEGDYIELNVNFFNVIGNNSLDAWVSALYGGDNDFSFISTTYEQLDSATGQMKLILYCQTTYTNQNKYLSIRSSMSQLHLFGGEYMSVYYLTRYKLSNDFGGQLDDIISSINAMDNTLQQLYGNSSTTNNKLDEINDTLEEQRQEEEDALDDATTDAQDGADDSSQDAENATTGLISIISGFVSAVTSATPSDCNINGNLGHINMGTMDMCSLPVPSFVQIIGSIILILVCIPFVIIMFNRFISLFRSFQG